MKNDLQIQKDVIEELSWDPILNSSGIGVAVKNGVVTLSGKVDSLTQKLAAEKDARKISGVKAIAEDIQIGVSNSSQKTDTEIADAILHALKWHSGVQEEKIKIKVENGNVQLDGEVEWEYQREFAKKSIENLTGVRSVLNLIKLKPRLSASDIRQKIGLALHRSATVEAEKIKVEVEGSKVVLEGTVRSIAEKEDVEQTAWNAPGVNSVVNRLRVEMPEYSFKEWE